MKQCILNLFIILLMISNSLIAAEHELDKGSIGAGGSIYYFNQFGDAIIDRQLFIADVIVEDVVILQLNQFDEPSLPTNNK